MKVPTEYKDGYEAGLKANPELATKYVAHTTVGDPVADEMVRDLEHFDKQDSERFIHLGMESQDRSVIAEAPNSVRRFFDACEATPDWVDLDSFHPGSRMFFRQPHLILAGMVGGVLVEGFATNIAKSFFLTGRLRDKGKRRLMQNNRHMLEIFWPGGMERFGDGWRLSVRIRIVHARIRMLLESSDEWDVEEIGTPLSGAHLGLALASFSARLLVHLRSLGGSASQEERDSFMAVWRYSGFLMGIPETVLYESEQDALEFFRIGRICEPPPSLESIVLASSLVNSAPLLTPLKDIEKRRELADYIGQISRALIGDEMADELKFPERSGFGILLKFRVLNRIDTVLNHLNPARAKANNNMRTILSVSMYDESGINYRIPDNVHSEKSSDW